MGAGGESLEELINYNLMTSFFGEGSAATRGANALWRCGVRSMEQLDQLAELRSEQGFHEYLEDIRGLGERSVKGITSGLKRFREEQAHALNFQTAQTASDGTAVAYRNAREEFRHHLYWTARHVCGDLVDLFPDVKDDEGKPAGLTSDDIVLLSRLLGRK